jgi:hypothetical protein
VIAAQYALDTNAASLEMSPTAQQDAKAHWTSAPTRRSLTGCRGLACSSLLLRASPRVPPPVHPLRRGKGFDLVHYAEIDE